MNKEAGTPEGLNKVCRLGKKWETGKSTGNQPTNQRINSYLIDKTVTWSHWERYTQTSLRKMK